MEIIDVSKAFVHPSRSRKIFVRHGQHPGMGHGEGTKKADSKILYENMNISIKKGEIFALIGPNGVGKTTLMRMILGWDHDYTGAIKKDDFTKISYSPECPDFPGCLTGKELLDLFIEIQKSHDDSSALLEKVGLQANDATTIQNYSKGMKQRLGVAQALIGSPDLLLLDEPTAGLDYLGQKHMTDLFLAFKREGKTIILNSHLLLDVEQICDRGVIIIGPGLVRCFSREDLEDQSLGEMFLALAAEKQRMEEMQRPEERQRSEEMQRPAVNQKFANQQRLAENQREEENHDQFYQA